MTLKQQIVEAVMEKVYCLLNEGRNAENAKKKTLAVIRNFFNNAEWLDNVVRNDANPNNLSVIDYIENKLKELCFHANIPDSVIRLEPMIMRIALSLGFEQANPNSAKLNRLFRIANCLPDLPKLKQDKMLPENFQLNQLDLDKTTYEDLERIFGTILDDMDKAEKERINNADYSKGINPNYKILPNIDYKTAKFYGDYSCSTSKLCYTQSESTWNQYTNGGSNTVYLLLHNDWEEIPEEHGKDTPYDDYGLSMIFVFVDEEGNIAYSNTRWNHQTDGKGPKNVDQSFSKEQLSQLLNAKFENIFKPLHTFAEKVAKAKQQLQNGADPNDVFEKVYPFHDGFAQVKLNGKWNTINTEGELLSDRWFDWFDKFYEGFAEVKLGGKYNYITTDGNLLNEDLWFDDAYNFHDGFAKVELNDKYNYINTDGELLRDDLWFDEVYYFYKGLARVILNGKKYYINTDGKIFGDDLWFDYIDDFSEDGFAQVKLNGKRNYINTDGKILSDLWFNYVGPFHYGIAWVELNGKYNYINTDGELLSEDLWFDVINHFSEDGIAWVMLNDKWNFINTDGEFLSENLWFDYVGSFHNGFAVVKLNGKYNFIDRKGNFLRDDLWFNLAYDFEDGFAKVHLNYRRYYIDTNGNLYDLNKNPIENVTENKQRVLRITESQLRNTIKRVVTQYLNESRRR